MADSLEVIGSATGCGGGPQKKKFGTISRLFQLSYNPKRFQITGSRRVGGWSSGARHASVGVGEKPPPQSCIKIGVSYHFDV